MSKPLALIILDGFGFREDKSDNAIALAHTPFLDHLNQRYPHTLLSGSGRCVGLPDGQMGNSEVGHLNMGAGRIVHQDLSRIDLAIEDGSFFANPVLLAALQTARDSDCAVHVIGLLSDGGVHSHERHMQTLVTMAAQQHVSRLFIHAFLDGRDTPPKSAKQSLAPLEGKIASIIGRYYAMDRDKRWDRVQQAYDLLTLGRAHYHADTAIEALAAAYARGESDEFVQATVIQSAQIQSGDIVIFMNYRADRARELTEAFIKPDFTGFTRTRVPALREFICLTTYDSHFKLPVAFPPVTLTNLFGEYISRHGLRQLRIAETEKYAHVTFFFNGGIEAPSPQEDRILIPSPKVATYDLQPEMSAPLLTEKLVAAIQSKQYDVIICNFANPDMVGHTGNLSATIKAIETIDQSLAAIITALQTIGGEAIITADHGNAEQMFDPITQQPHTAHTSDPVPFIYVGRSAEVIQKEGKLSDIAPTMLYLLGLAVPKEMTGTPLVALV